MSNEEPIASKMTRKQIDARIEYIEEKICRATHVEDLKSLNRTLQRLLLLVGSDEE